MLLYQSLRIQVKLYIIYNTMHIPLSSFEKLIDPTIINRGLHYFENGQVLRVEELSPGQYEAQVDGSEDYTLQFTLERDIITDQVCDCPYDLGPVCKHMVAVIFHLLQDRLELAEPKKIKKREVRAHLPKKKSDVQLLKEVLNHVNDQELREFVYQKGLIDESFRSYFLTSFIEYHPGDSKMVFAKRLKAVLRSAQGRKGFIEWSSTKEVSKELDDLLDVAEREFTRRNFKTAIFIAEAVMEQMVEALQYSDDSSGYFGGAIEISYSLLQKIAQAITSEEIRILLLDFCFSSFEKKIYSGWDWHMGMLFIASELVKTKEEQMKIFDFLDRVDDSDFERGRAESITYDLLVKFEGQQTAEDYLERHLHNSSLRRMAIQKAFTQNNFEKARSLALDGVDCDLKDKPGLAKEWYDWLLKIAQAQEDTPRIIEYARLLFIDNFRSEQDYYQVLKDHVNPEDWDNYVESIIRHLQTKKPWVATGLIATIFIREEWWSRLMELVNKAPSLSTISQYEQYLIKDYRDQIVELYARGVLYYLSQQVGRNHYQNACVYLRRIKKLGAGDRVEEIISFLRKEYPQRKALMDELNRV